MSHVIEESEGLQGFRAHDLHISNSKCKGSCLVFSKVINGL